METEGVMGSKYEESRRRFERLTEHRMECKECGKEWHSIRCKKGQELWRDWYSYEI